MDKIKEVCIYNYIYVYISIYMYTDAHIYMKWRTSIHMIYIYISCVYRKTSLKADREVCGGGGIARRCHF